MIKAFARSACHSEDRGPDFDRIKTWPFKIFEPSKRISDGA